MILQYWQIEAAFLAAKKQLPAVSLVGTRINYQFCHETAPGVDNGICGFFGWIYEHKNPDAPEGEPMDLVLAIDTSIEGFYVTLEVKALFSRENLAGDCTNINQADRSKDIDDSIYGPEDDNKE